MVFQKDWSCAFKFSVGGVILYFIVCFACFNSKQPILVWHIYHQVQSRLIIRVIAQVSPGPILTQLGCIAPHSLYGLMILLSCGTDYGERHELGSGRLERLARQTTFASAEYVFI